MASLPGEYGDPEDVVIGRGEQRWRRSAAPRGQPAEQVAEDRHGAEEEHLRQEDHTQLKGGNGNDHNYLVYKTMSGLPRCQRVTKKFSGKCII